MNISTTLTDRLSTLLACTALFCTFNLSPVSAGTITGATVFGPNSGTGPGVGLVAVPIITTPNPANDNDPGALPNNVDVVVKRFDANGYIDIEFNVVGDNGVTEYLVFEAVDNNTGLPWVGYTMQLGFGTGGSFAPSTANDGLDFDFPNFDSAPASTGFPNVTLSEDVLNFDGGVQGAGLQTYQVRVDVPNGIEQFTLRQTPTAIPEPATLGLAGVALLGAFAIRRRA